MQAMTKKIRFVALIAAGILLLLVGGCSSVPKPVGELASAETAISQAEYSGAGKYAPVELDSANTKLMESYVEFKEDNFHKARRLANEALVEANLASAKMTAAKTIKATKAMEESVLLLQESLKRGRFR